MSNEHVDNNTAPPVEKEVGTHKPEDVAAFTFTKSLQQFEAIVNDLSIKSLKRLVKSMARHPLEQEFTMLDPREKMAFSLAKNLDECKLILKLFALNEQANQIGENENGRDKEEVQNHESGSSNEEQVSQG